MPGKRLSPGGVAGVQWALTRRYRGQFRRESRRKVINPRRTQTRKPGDSQRTTLIEAITSPLGFFVLALLIVEAFLATVLLGAQLQPDQKMICVWLGVGMFVLVVTGVWLLVWTKPANLTFDKYAHLVDRGKIPYGTDQERVLPANRFAPAEKGTEP